MATASGDTLNTSTAWNPPALSAPPVSPPSLNGDNVTTTTVAPLVSPAIMAMWQKVAQCETGGNWHSMGHTYQGGLGILVTNWYYFGGFKMFGPLYDATPEQQVFIAIKIQASDGVPNFVPDQHGCSGSW